jgi:hypothetical protein
MGQRKNSILGACLLTKPTRKMENIRREQPLEFTCEPSSCSSYSVYIEDELYHLTSAVDLGLANVTKPIGKLWPRASEVGVLGTAELHIEI